MAIRTPTPQHELYAWWVASLAGERPQITHEPQCGYFKRRLVKDGPWIVARIWLHQETDSIGELTAPEEMRCEVDGKERDPVDQWTWLAGRPITREEYRHLRAVRTWAKAHAPDQPEADPDKPVDWNDVPITF